jgi:hypothetical protein
VLKIRLLIIRFIVLLTSYLIPRILSTSALIKLINFVNMETFGLLYYIFYTEFIVRLRVFDALYCLNLFFYRTIYSN